MPECPLRVLRLCRSGLSCDEGLVAVAERFGSTLQVLDASGSPVVSDAGLLALHGCSALTSLDLSSSSITEDGTYMYAASLLFVQSFRDWVHCQRPSRQHIGISVMQRV